VDFAAALPVIKPVPSALGPDGRPQQYGDLRWAPRHQLLAAVDAGLALDVLEVMG
jgi:hypothetical protein